MNGLAVCTPVQPHPTPSLADLHELRAVLGSLAEEAAFTGYASCTLRSWAIAVQRRCLAGPESATAPLVMTLLQQGRLVQKSACEMPVARSPMEQRHAEQQWGQR